MSQNILINTAHTLSVRNSPGEDKLYQNVSTESIFTFGDFRIQRNISSNLLSSDTRQFSFSSFGSLSTLSNDQFDASTVINTTVNDLNPKTDEANSYAYFGSFYTKVANAINNIINTFPYAMSFYDYGTGNTILNYTNTFSGTSIFDLTLSSITNQGEIIYASGVSASSSTEVTLFNDWDQFEIQLFNSADTHTIQSYSHNVSNGRLQFEIAGTLFTGTTSASTFGIYVRPTVKRYSQYKKTLSNLEYQILFEKKFMIPNPDDDTFESTSIEWPTLIDGFNPDLSGNAFRTYLNTLLNACSSIDEIKTNWMVRTMLPENYIDFDSNTDSSNNSTEIGIYRKITTVYAEEFDKIKQYIDGLAYAHTVDYHDQEAIPNKFMHRLSSLLGWEAINEFNDTDIFSYLAKEDTEGFTKSDYNFQLWKKILININWLYKKKGTRDALQFIFKLMGAPNCLVNFNELVYRINQSATATTLANTTSSKINIDGYPNYEMSQWEFQEGGQGRGDGDKYISQWEPEFHPIREIDNIKVHTGDTEFNGTSNVINSKQLNIQLSPAAAIECDLKKWYDLGFTTGSTTNVQAGIPSYINLAGVRVHQPPSVSAMTVAQWLDYAYTNSINPTTRKTIDYNAGHNFYYQNLKDLYLAYYFWSKTNEVSNKLNFRKIEPFLDLIQRNFDAYIQRLIPATTILEGEGVLYRNTLFNRQKYVYQEGINKGSEFQIKAPVTPRAQVNGVSIVAAVNEPLLNVSPNAFVLSSTINTNNITRSITSVSVENEVDVGINVTINALEVTGTLSVTSIISKNQIPSAPGDISVFPTSMVPEAQASPVPIPYSTKTGRNRYVPVEVQSALD